MAIEINIEGVPFIVSRGINFLTGGMIRLVDLTPKGEYQVVDLYRPVADQPGEVRDVRFVPGREVEQ